MRLDIFLNLVILLCYEYFLLECKVRFSVHLVSRQQLRVVRARLPNRAGARMRGYGKYGAGSRDYTV